MKKEMLLFTLSILVNLFNFIFKSFFLFQKLDDGGTDSTFEIEDILLKAKIDYNAGKKFLRL
jgi:ubiquinone biosynthesis protein Coq4